MTATPTSQNPPDSEAQAKKSDKVTVSNLKKKAAAKKATPKKKAVVKSAAAKKPKAAKAKAKLAKKKPAAAMVEKVPEILAGMYDYKRYEMDSTVSRIHTLCQSLAQLAASPGGTTGFGEKNSLDKARDGIADAIDKQIYALNGLTKESLPWDAETEVNKDVEDKSAADISRKIDSDQSGSVATTPHPTIPVASCPQHDSGPIPIPGANS